MRTLALSAVLLLSSAAPGLAARPGTLDETFGGDGRVETRVAGGLPKAVGVESLPGGKTLVVGTVGEPENGAAARKLVLIRYRRDGRLDRAFGRGGVRALAFDGIVEAADTLLDAEGRLLVGGALGPFGSPERTPVVLRFDRRGHLDPTFDQDGIAQLDFAGGEQGGTASGIALSPTGSIVVTASIDTPPGRGLGVARLDTSGALDPTFGDRGLVRMFVDVPYTSDANGLGVETDGRIAIAVTLGAPAESSSYVVKLLGDGTPDTSFGAGPYGPPGSQPVRSEESAGVADLVVDPQTARILLAGTSCGSACIFTSPWVTSAPGSPRWGSLIEADRRGAYGEALALDRAGRAVVVGAATFSAAPPEGRLFTRLYAYMVVARLNSAGKVDRCFGRKGIARVWFPNKLSRPAGLAITPAGKIVVAGPAGWGERTPTKFQVARLHGGACRRR